MEKRMKLKIAENIRKLRHNLNLSQEQLAERLGVRFQAVSKWERDERMPDISLLPAIAEIFGITTDELLRGERNNPERETVVTEETVAKQKAKSDKQFNNMLEQQKKIYKRLINLYTIT